MTNSPSTDACTRAAGRASHPAATCSLTAERFDPESAPEVAVEGDAILLRRAARDPALATPRQVTRVDTVSSGPRSSDQTIALRLRLVEAGRGASVVRKLIVPRP